MLILVLWAYAQVLSLLFLLVQKYKYLRRRRSKALFVGFGADIASYKVVGIAFLNCIQAIIVGLDVTALRDLDASFGILLYLSFQFFTIIFLTNFVVVIMVTYEEIASEVVEDPLDIHFREGIKMHWNSSKETCLRAHVRIKMWLSKIKNPTFHRWGASNLQINRVYDLPQEIPNSERRERVEPQASGKTWSFSRIQARVAAKVQGATATEINRSKSLQRSFLTPEDQLEESLQKEVACMSNLQQNMLADMLHEACPSPVHADLIREKRAVPLSSLISLVGTVKQLTLKVKQLEEQLVNTEEAYTKHGKIETQLLVRTQLRKSLQIHIHNEQ
jgi:hypothetical protein